MYIHVRLRHDIAALGRDHDARTPGPTIRIVDRLEEGTRDTGRALYARLVVELAIAIRGTILDPVPLLAATIAHVAGRERSIILRELVGAFEAWTRVRVYALGPEQGCDGYLDKLLL